MRQKNLIRMCLVLVMLVSFGCAGMGLNVNVSEEAVYSIERIASRTLAYKLAEKYPGSVEDMSNFCGDFIKALDAEQPIYANMEMAKKYIATKLMEDPLLQANFYELLSLLDLQVEPVPGGTLPDLSPELKLKVRVAAAGFLEGLILQTTGTFVRVE